MPLNRWSSFEILPHMIALNRVVVPAMASATSSQEGFVTNKTLQHYKRLSEVGAGIVFAEYTYIHPTGRSELHQLGAWSDEHIAGLKAIATLIKRSGALAGLQLVHAGGKTSAMLAHGDVMGPSAILVPTKDRVLDVPRPMTVKDIELWKSSYLQAARRAVRAGFDIVELHASHGYGLNQWLSPLTNQRSDEYGNDEQGRVRLILEIVALLRSRLSTLALSVRLPGQDFLPNGLTVADMQNVASQLSESGVNVVNISSGLGGWRRPIDRNMEGYLVDEAAVIQSSIKAPVIGVGGIETGSTIDYFIGSGKIAFAAVGRAVLRDPKSWGEQNLKQTRSSFLGACNEI